MYQHIIFQMNRCRIDAMRYYIHFIICLIFLIHQSAGITLTGSSYAVLDQIYRFTCTATEASAQQLLTFRKNGGSACTLIHLLNSTQCQQFAASSGYSCSCGQNGVYYMNISSVSLQDENTWDCQLSGGSVSSPTSNNIFLPVYYPPDKPTITDPGSLCEGKSTYMTCSSSDPVNPPATYYWTKNTVSMATGSPYTFTPGRDDHQAQIRCEAGNDYTDRSGYSRPQSDVRQLNVYYIPRITTSLAPDQTRNEGQSLSLICSADSNPDNAVLSWIFNGTTLTGVSVEKTNLSRSDHGMYTCTGRVDTGSVCPRGFLQGQGNVNVIVNFAPDIIFNPVDIREGEALTLTCEANGRPETYTFGRFTQYWEDTEVERYIGTKTGSAYTWTKHNATYLETGVYECSVDNTISDRRNMSEQTKRVSVHVRASPKFTTDMEQIVGAEIGSPVTLTQSFYNSYLNYTSVNWTFSELKSLLYGSSTVTPTNVTLKKNDKAVKMEGFTSSLVIESFQEKDIGTYTVTACNSIGCSSSDVNLTAAGRLLVPLDFSVTNTTHRTISLRWKPNFPGGDFTQVFILHYRFQGSEDWQTMEYEDNPGGYVYADVTGLQPVSVYEFKVRARSTRENDNEGDFTNILLAVTKSLPVNTDSSSSLGIGLGIGLGICLPLIIGLVVLVSYFRRRMLSPKRRGHGQHSSSGRQSGADNRAYLADPSNNQDRAEYSGLEESSPQPYAQLHLYQNTQGRSNDDTGNESIRAEYEAVTLHTYENTGNNSKDPTYVNTSRK